MIRAAPGGAAMTGAATEGAVTTRRPAGVKLSSPWAIGCSFWSILMPQILFSVSIFVIFVVSYLTLPKFNANDDNFQSSPSLRRPPLAHSVAPCSLQPRAARPLLPAY